MYSCKLFSKQFFRRPVHAVVVIAVCVCMMIITAQNLSAQMPGWATIRDGDGNRYFVDRDFRIHVTGDVESRYKPVSIEGLEYYLSQGEELMRQHHPVEGLYFLKGIRLLSDTDPRAMSAGMRASKIINDCVKREKERYAALDHASACILVKKDKTIGVCNSWLGYVMEIHGETSVVSRKIREIHNHASDSTAFGIRFGVTDARDKTSDKRYDALIFVTGEIFHYQIGTHASFEEIWRNRNGEDAFARETVRESEKEIFYRIRGGAPDTYSGYERFIVRGTRAVHVRIIAPDERFASLDSEMKKTIESFALQGDQ
jgi:hypothetical protein